MEFQAWKVMESLLESWNLKIKAVGSQKESFWMWVCVKFANHHQFFKLCCEWAKGFQTSDSDRLGFLLRHFQELWLACATASHWLSHHLLCIEFESGVNQLCGGITCEKMPGKCQFTKTKCKRWRANKDYGDWLAPHSQLLSMAFCTACDKAFDISNMGEAALKNHCKGTKHKHLLIVIVKNQQENNSRISDFLAPSSKPTPSTRSTACVKFLRCLSCQSLQLGRIRLPVAVAVPVTCCRLSYLGIVCWKQKFCGPSKLWLRITHSRVRQTQRGCSRLYFDSMIAEKMTKMTMTT